MLFSSLFSWRLMRSVSCVSLGRVNLLRTAQSVRRTQCISVNSQINTSKTKTRLVFCSADNKGGKYSYIRCECMRKYYAIYRGNNWEVRKGTSRCTTWVACVYSLVISRAARCMRNTIGKWKAAANARLRICRYQWRGNKKYVIKSSTFPMLKRESPIWLLCALRSGTDERHALWRFSPIILVSHSTVQVRIIRMADPLLKRVSTRIHTFPIRRDGTVRPISGQAICFACFGSSRPCTHKCRLSTRSPFQWISLPASTYVQLCLRFVLASCVLPLRIMPLLNPQ